MQSFWIFLTDNHVKKVDTSHYNKNKVSKKIKFCWI